MKKIFSILTLIALLVCFCSCLENDYVSNEGGITLTIASDCASYMDGQIPSFTFEYEGNLNTVAGNEYSFYTSFCQNDDLVLSRTIAKLFEKYKDDMYVVVDETKTGLKTHLNVIENGKRVKQKINIDDGYKYYETAYIYLDNGLQLVMTYCRFLYQGEVIYRWRETKNIEMKLLYPLMVIKEEDVKKFIITPLPYLITMHVSGSSTVIAGKIMADDKYVAISGEDNIYYTYDYDENKTTEESKAFVSEYYQKYLNATGNGDVLDFEYNGYLFSVHLYDSYFCIRPEGKK